MIVLNCGMSKTPPSGERLPRMRAARGPKRPDYMGNPDLDRFMMMFTALMADVSALRDRLDTHELLAADGKVATPDAIEAFEPAPQDIARRSALRDAFLKRIFRVVFEDLERAERGPDGSISGSEEAESA